MLSRTIGIDLSSTNIGICYYDAALCISKVLTLEKFNHNNLLFNMNEIEKNLLMLFKYNANLVIVEVSDFVNPALTNRFHRMYGWIEHICFKNKVECKAITPNEWRKYVYVDIFNWRNLERKELKKLAIKKANELQHKLIESDDEAEAILIAMFGRYCNDMLLVKEENIAFKKENKDIQKKKKSMRKIISKLKEKGTLTKAQQEKLDKNKELLKTMKNKEK